ncbi:MAG: DUF4440 domain-containing protein [Ilumatobacter sp.]
MAEPTIQSLLALEAAVWDALVAGDSTADSEALTDDFLGVYPTGFAGRDDHVGQLDQGPTVVSYQLRDARVRVITPDDALLSYRADYRRTDAAHDETMYVSSLWSRVDGGWRNVFSQDTPAGDAVP